MINNTKEAVRTFGCAAELAHNVSKEFAYLTVTPFTSALLGVDHRDAKSLAKAVQSVQDQISPLHQVFDFPDEDDDQENSDRGSIEVFINFILHMKITKFLK